MSAPSGRRSAPRQTAMSAGQRTVNQLSGVYIYKACKDRNACKEEIIKYPQCKSFFK